MASSDWLDATEAMRGTFRRVIAEDLSPTSRTYAPRRCSCGGARRGPPLWMGRRMEEAIPDAGLVVLDGGHYAYAERAAEFNRIAAHFLADA